MLDGMILPYFYGFLFLDEEITVMKVIALLTTAIAIILQNKGDKKNGKTLFYILCVSVFILNGLTSVVSKMHQSNPQYSTVSSNGFVLLTNLTLFLVFGAMIPFVRKKGSNIFAMSPKLYIIIIGSAILSSVAYFLQLLCALFVPAIIQFPVMSGGTIIFVTLLGVICFKEKIFKRQAMCLFLCVIATVIFVL